MACHPEISRQRINYGQLPVASMRPCAQRAAALVKVWTPQRATEVYYCRYGLLNGPLPSSGLKDMMATIPYGIFGNRGSQPITTTFCGQDPSA